MISLHMLLLSLALYAAPTTNDDRICFTRSEVATLRTTIADAKAALSRSHIDCQLRNEQQRVVLTAQLRQCEARRCPSTVVPWVVVGVILVVSAGAIIGVVATRK